MQIKLPNEYLLKSNINQWVLARYKSEREIIIGYYSDLADLLQDFVSVCLRTSNCKSVEELLNYQKSLITALNKAITPLKIEVLTKSQK